MLAASWGVPSSAAHQPVQHGGYAHAAGQSHIMVMQHRLCFDMLSSMAATSDAKHGAMISAAAWVTPAATDP